MKRTRWAPRLFFAVFGVNPIPSRLVSMDVRDRKRQGSFRCARSHATRLCAAIVAISGAGIAFHSNLALATPQRLATPAVPKTKSFDDVTALRYADGLMTLFANGTNGHVMSASQMTSGVWTPWADLGGSPASQVTAAINPSGVVSAFYIGANGNMYSATQMSSGVWTGWADIGGQLVGVPTALSYKDGLFTAFGTGTNGHVMSASQMTSGVWTPWADLGGSPASQVTAAINPSGVVSAFYIGANGNMYSATQMSSGVWTGWADIGGQLVGNPAARAYKDGLFTAFGIGPDGHAYSASQTLSGVWSPWADLGGNLGIPPAPLRITTPSTESSPPNAIVGVPYSFTFSASGGDAFYSWRLLSGHLPSGLSLSSGGSISGTSEQVSEGGPFTVEVTSGSQTAEENFTIWVLAANSLHITTPSTSDSPPNAIIGSDYSFTFSAAGGTGSYSWSLAGGNLPGGLALSADGLIYGSPDQISEGGPFTVEVTSGSQTAEENFTIWATPYSGANYLVELSAWIPQQWVVDPLNPASQAPCNSTGCSNDGPQNPLINCGSGTSTVDSVFAGDNHTNFNSSFNTTASDQIDRGEIWASFDYNGSTFSNVGAETVYGTTHRFIDYNNGSSYCVNEQQAGDNGGVGATSNELQLTLDTANPLVPLTPDIHAVVDITGQSNGTLILTYQTTFFPSIAISVARADTRIRDTDIVNDPSCLGQSQVLGPIGAGVIALGLANFNNDGQVTVNSNSGSGTIDQGDTDLC
jgi:hypothetical protein